MKRYIALILALMLCLCLLTACGDKNSEPEPENTSEPVPTESGNPEPVPEETPAPVPVWLPLTDDAGQEYIDRLIFIGDSTTYGLKAYSVLSGGTETEQVWTPTSGTLALFNQSIATIVYPKTGEEILIVDAVADAQPEYLVLTIGVNGVAMMDEESFKREYIDLIQRIQAASPDTKIICNSIYPVEASYEAKDNGINNAKINNANIWILDIAEATGTHYADSASVLRAADGCLDPQFGNGDGIHLCAEGFNRVLNYLRTHALF
ncbi:MAG: hypothetical protein HUJ66_06945 [Oscillospiraceae bacterium]|nr:hypothetical protein [Oscillospiraceae bacterium]